MNTATPAADIDVEVPKTDKEMSELKLQHRLLTPFLSKKVPPIPSDEERKPYGQYHANFLSKIMFAWLYPLLSVGYKRTLTENDLFYLEDQQTVQTMYTDFKKHFDDQLKKTTINYVQKKYKEKNQTFNPDAEFSEDDLEGYKVPSYVIPLCLFKTLKFEYSLGNFLMIISDVASCVSPLLQKKLINFVGMRDFGLSPSVGKGVGYAIGVCLLIFLNAITINHSFHMLMVCGAKSRAILTRLLLDKALSIDAKGVHKFPASKVQSMISTDMNRVDMAVCYFPFLLIAVIPVAICIGLLIWNIGVSALVGIAIFVMVMFILGATIKRLMSFRQIISKYTDLRVNLMKELLKNYQMIKFYSWEGSYSKRIQDARFTEMKYVLNLQATRNVLVSFAFAMPILASMATFLTAFQISSGKNAADLFSSLTLFNVLAIQFMMVPLAINVTADMAVSSRKICDFLTEPDINEEEFSTIPFKDDELALKIEDATFDWETFEDDKTENDVDPAKSSLNDENEPSAAKKEKTFDLEKAASSLDKSSITSYSSLEKKSALHEVAKTEFQGLHDINLNIKKGEFIVVTGTIGSGKSSLLCAMAGLMRRTEGKVLVDGDLLLCGYPWVQNATIRDNITFGLPFDEEKYYTVVDACSLGSDFAQFPGGDMTEVGERGITLSGGQKARINLARAVYADKEIVLLDDVLSAVDAKVGKHIVENCILGLMGSKTRIMATHQLSLISSADRMVFLNGDGSIDVGTTDELLSRNVAFSNLLKFQKKSKEGTSGDDDGEIGSEIHSIKAEMIRNEQEELKAQGIEIQLSRAATRASAVASLDAEKRERTPDHEKVTIIGDEEKAVNSLSLSVYVNYCRLAFGKLGWAGLGLYITFAALTTFCNLFTNTWLSFWIENKFDGRGKPFYEGIYIMFSFLYTFCLAINFYMICYFTNKAARMLNFQAAQKILHVPMAFMDVSPIGRVLNRFTKDTDVLDNELAEQVRQLLNPLANVIGTIILCIIYIPWFAIAVPLIIMFYISVANFYQASGREIKRMEATKRSLVYSHFNEALSGKDTIKAYRIQPRIKDKLDKLIDSQNEAYFLTVASQRWLGSTLAVLAFCMVLVISLLCVFRIFNISAASTGLLLTYVINVTGIMSMMMRALTQVENEFNSVERLNHYAFDLVQEAPYEIPENDPPASWPENGRIKFDHVNMKYRPELPYVLKDINLDIQKTEKIGFCGRTGAGKSTFMTCLYRFTEFEGKIIIDDVDIQKLGLHALRSKLTIIPQDPVLFMGTIRTNLDPFSEQSDERLWEALCIASLIKKEDLESVKLQHKDDDNLHKFHLNRAVEDDGSNFSIGERQLIALARALVRKTKILILDEATSSVDYETDAKIQKTISTEFNDCTILCIAHRLNTILNYDKIAVMNAGEVVEYDHPKTLFMNENGVFRSMCEQAKITIEDFA